MRKNRPVMQSAFGYTEIDAREGSDVKNVIQDVVDYIEAHIESPLTLEECAQAVGYSKYHLHRLFQYYAGETLMQYVRKRKMMHGALRIRRGQRISDVALDLGYSSDRAFARAFRAVNRCAPNECKKRSMLWLDPIIIEELENIGGERVEHYLSEVFFETLPDLTVVSAVVISKNPEEEVIAFLENWVKEQPDLKAGRSFGFDVPVSPAQQDEGIRGYEYWISITGQAKITNGVSIKTIPGTKYAVLRITDPFADPFNRIGKGWNRLVEWMKDHAKPEKEIQGMRYCLEEVKEMDGVTVMDIFMAVE